MLSSFSSRVFSWEMILRVAMVVYLCGLGGEVGGGGGLWN
jgi:hypothetical protein